MSSKTVSYWWLNANPHIWDFESHPLYQTETYSSYNENGNKRKKYKWFLEVKPGDIALGYVTTPRKKIVAVCKITKGLHPIGKKGEIYFQKIEHLANPIAFEELQAIPELANCEPLANNQGSLFKLTEAEYRKIRSLESADGDLIADIQKINKNKKIGKTTIQSLVNARVGQGKYGMVVRKMWHRRCAVTGSSTKAVLEASHIKPWSDSSNFERLDPHNGLLLTANLHKLFDAGLISFDKSRRILISSSLSGAERRIFGLNGKMLLRKPSSKMAKYLAYHRGIFKR